MRSCGVKGDAISPTVGSGGLRLDDKFSNIR